MTWHDITSHHITSHHVIIDQPYHVVAYLSALWHCNILSYKLRHIWLQRGCNSDCGSVLQRWNEPAQSNSQLSCLVISELKQNMATIFEETCTSLYTHWAIHHFPSHHYCYHSHYHYYYSVVILIIHIITITITISIPFVACLCWRKTKVVLVKVVSWIIKYLHSLIYICVMKLKCMCI